MTKDPDVFIGHILDSIEHIQSYIAKMSKGDFEKNEQAQDAVTWRFQIIGEATKNLPADFRESHPDIPWGKMAKMRDKLVHFYFGINFEIVWDTVKKELPPIKTLLEKL